MAAEEVRRSGFDNLMLITQGHVAFQSLKSGLDLKLFDLLQEQGPMTSEEIQKYLGMEEVPCKILLRALYSLNLLIKENDKYLNSQTAGDYLTTTGPYPLQDILGWQNDIVYRGIVDFTEALKANENVGLKNFAGKGDNLYERLSFDSELEGTFQKAMSALSTTANLEFFKRMDLTGVDTIVDVGGGQGTNLMTLLKERPNLNGIVFDLPTVCELAKKNIVAHNMDGQVSIHPGNLFTDDFPAEMNAVMFCHMFTIWSGEKITQILKKCYESLPQGGKVFVFNMMSNDDEYGPISCALGSPYFLTIATGEGKLHTTCEYEKWFKDAGFEKIKFYRDLPMDHGFVEATK